MHYSKSCIFTHFREFESKYKPRQILEISTNLPKKCRHIKATHFNTAAVLFILLFRNNRFIMWRAERFEPIISENGLILKPFLTSILQRLLNLNLNAILLILQQRMVGHRAFHSHSSHPRADFASMWLIRISSYNELA